MKTEEVIFPALPFCKYLQVENREMSNAAKPDGLPIRCPPGRELQKGRIQTNSRYLYYVKYF